MYLFRNKARYVDWKTVNVGFCEKMEVTRVTPGRPWRTTSGTLAPQVGKPCSKGQCKY